MKQKLRIRILACLLGLCLLAGCGTKPAAPTTAAASDPSDPTTAAAPTAAPDPRPPAESETVPETTEPAFPEPEPETDPAEAPGADTLVVGVTQLPAEFNPFYCSPSLSRNEVLELTQARLLEPDREGYPVLRGIEGETRSYCGTDYTYCGIADCEIEQNPDGTVDYRFTLREDLYFSDGMPLTADDVLFTIYTLCDPLYDGEFAFGSLPIEGLAEYRGDMEPKLTVIARAGRDNADFTLWTPEEQTLFWEDLDRAGERFAQEIVDYCNANWVEDYAEAYVNASADEVRDDEGLQVKLAMFLWGFSDGWFEGADAADFFRVMCEAYDMDLFELSRRESAGSSLFDLMEDYDRWNVGVETGPSAPTISGVRKTGDRSFTVRLTKADPTAIYAFCFPVAPLHRYGDASLLGEASFGFPKGNLLSQKAVTEPLGAGPYTLTAQNAEEVILTANPNYWKGEPVTRTVILRELAEDALQPALAGGRIDLTVDWEQSDLPDQSSYTCTTVSKLQVGYIVINSDLVNVGGDPGSEASKNLRRGILTLLSVRRSDSLAAYASFNARVLREVISDTSWAAAGHTDPSLPEPYAADVDGNPIYTPEMTDEERYEAARTAAIGFFRAAGLSFDESTEKFTGVEEIWIFLVPGAGLRDHPAWTAAQWTTGVLKSLGIPVQLLDGSWSAASSSDPPAMYAFSIQVREDPVQGELRSFGASDSSASSGDSSVVGAAAIGAAVTSDPALISLYRAGMETLDQEERKAIYRQAEELLTDWAVVLPYYQLQQPYVFSAQRIDTETLSPDMTVYWSWTREIEALRMKPVETTDPSS